MSTVYYVGEEVEFVKEARDLDTVYALVGDRGIISKVFPLTVYVNRIERRVFEDQIKAVKPSEDLTKVNVKTTASSFLETAQLHMNERAKVYDSPDGERSMKKAVDAFNSVTGHCLKESDGWLLLQLLKDTRQWSTEDYHADSAEDCIAYAALKAESLSRGD